LFTAILLAGRSNVAWLLVAYKDPLQKPWADAAQPSRPDAGRRGAGVSHASRDTHVGHSIRVHAAVRRARCTLQPDITWRNLRRVIDLRDDAHLNKR
jgi:hypothetical protein